MFQQMGFGLAVAVLIDATIVRTIIVPAAMGLPGDWNWYLPRWLRWIPDISMEGRSHEPAAPKESRRLQAPRPFDVRRGGHAAGATAARLRPASPPR